MSHELLYTSAPRGLQPGSRGFCTVAMTQGLPSPVLEKLEQLSGYRALFPPHDAKAALNPVSYAHLRLAVGGRTLRVLSRVCAAGLDYTERTNTFAHHVLLGTGELPPAGPAWLASQPGFLEPGWDGEVRVLTAGRTPPSGNLGPAPCLAWEETTGDAGWAGVLVEAFLTDPQRPSYLMFDPGVDPLPLLVEAIALLPVERRWEVTFSTYFTGLPQGVECAWRCVVRGTPEAKSRVPGALVLSLSQAAGAAPSSVAAEAARLGQSVVVAGPGAVDETGGPIPLREPVHGQSGRRPQPQHVAEPPRPALTMNTLPTSLAPGSTQPARMNPEPEKRGRALWVVGFFTGIATGILLSTMILGGLWFYGVLTTHDEDALVHLRDEIARLRTNEELLKKSNEKLNAEKPPPPPVSAKQQNEVTKGKQKSKDKSSDAAPTREPSPTTSSSQIGNQPTPPAGPPHDSQPATSQMSDVVMGFRLPAPGSNDDTVIPLEKYGFTGRSVKIRGVPWIVKQDSRMRLNSDAKDGRHFIYLEIPNLKSRVDLCSFATDDNKLIFRWERVQETDKKVVDEYFHYVADLVLDITSNEGKSQLLALREAIRIPPMHVPNVPDRYRLVWDAKPSPSTIPGRVNQTRPERELNLRSAKLSLPEAKPTPHLNHEGEGTDGLLKWRLDKHLTFAKWATKEETKTVSVAYQEKKMNKEEERQCKVKLEGHWELSEVSVRLLQSELEVEWKPQLKGGIVSSVPVPKNNAKSMNTDVLSKIKSQEKELVKNSQGTLPRVRPSLEEAVIYMKVEDNLRVLVLRVDRTVNDPVLEPIPKNLAIAGHD